MPTDVQKEASENLEISSECLYEKVELYQQTCKRKLFLYTFTIFAGILHLHLPSLTHFSQSFVLLIAGV